MAPVQIENVLAWRQGKIVFRNAPLAQVVAEMNRYLARPIRLDVPSLRDYRVAGVFNIDEPEAILAALPAVFGDLAPEEALRRLLADSGLEYARQSNTITLSRPSGNQAAQLDPVTVEGRNTMTTEGSGFVYRAGHRCRHRPAAVAP